MYVGILASIILVAVSVWIRSAKKASITNRLSYSYGCKPCPRLTNHRPWGLDRIEQIFRANKEFRLMELFMFHFRLLGNTLEHEFFGTRAFGTAEPRNIESILATRFEDWSLGLRRAVMYPLFGDGIFTQDDEPWRRSRRILRPQFAIRQYEDLHIFRKPMDTLLSSLPQQGTVDLQFSILQFTLEVTTMYLFGTSPAQSSYKSFAESFDKAQDYIAQRMRLQDLYWLIGGRDFRQACDTAHKFADQIIAARLADSSLEGRERSLTFLDSLAMECPDRKELRNQVMNVLIAGRDTTACLISWTIFHLVRRPNIMAELRAEIQATLQGEINFNRSQIHDLPLLQRVLKEVLRLHPPIPVNSRTAIRDTVLPVGGGTDGESPIFIPKGSVVAYCVYTMHRRPDLYGLDAKEFRPDRWKAPMPLDENATNARWGYLPFNGGPRVCLGTDFALTEAGYAIVRLLQTFAKIQRPKSEKVAFIGEEKQKMTLVMSNAGGCKVEIG